MNDAGLHTVQALHADASGRIVRAEPVVVETPVALLYNGRPYAVMMATPLDLEDFALGFALSEGVVAAAGEFRLVDVVHRDDGIGLHAAIPQARFDALDARRRNLEGRSGCGLCGVEALQDAVRPVAAVATLLQVPAARIHAGLELLASRQPLNAASGGMHAAGFLDAGVGLAVREDVGRHNALDKLVGALARQGIAPGDGCLLMSSRASFEIVHKAAAAGIGIIVAISAPTALAIRIAEQAGITLAAFARAQAMNIYTHPARITP